MATPVRPPLPSVPPCVTLGSQCHSLPVTLRIGTLEEGKTSLDHEATWLLGHTQHITFTDLWADDGDLYADAVLHVPCKHLRGDGVEATCAAHGFRGRAPRPRPRAAQPRQLGGDRFRLVDDMRLANRRLPSARPAPRSLPVLAPVEDGGNPCATARCETADHKRGAACCRDLQIEIMCTRRQTRLEALVRSRRSPYLCKVSRPGDFSIEAEMISACSYLEPGGVNCTLHGRTREDGRPAKPDLCSAWPEKRTGLHPGCVFSRRPRRATTRPSRSAADRP